MAKLRSHPSVDRVERNPRARAFGIPNDPYWYLQWNMQASEAGGIEAASAWDIATGQGAVVAVLDTGVAYEDRGRYRLATDLANTRFVEGYDFVNDDAHPNDDHGHGTHVAGTIAQSTGNGLGVAGVAPDAALMPVKVLDEAANGDYFTISEGIYYATDHGASVINLSLGGVADSSVLTEAVQYAHEHGVTLITAIGNEYQRRNPVMYPAA